MTPATGRLFDASQAEICALLQQPTASSGDTAERTKAAVASIFNVLKNTVNAECRSIYEENAAFVQHMEESLKKFGSRKRRALEAPEGAEQRAHKKRREYKNLLIQSAREMNIPKLRSALEREDVRTFFSKAVIPSDKDSREQFCLVDWAAQKGNIALMDLIQEKGLSLKGAILFTARHGQLDAMKWLHRQNPHSLLERTSANYTLLHIAAKLEHEEMIAWLCENDPNLITKLTSAYITPLHIAARAGSIPTMEKLFHKHPAAANQWSAANGYPAHQTIVSNSVDAINWLGERINIKEQLRANTKKVIQSLLVGDSDQALQWLYDQDHAYWLEAKTYEGDTLFDCVHRSPSKYPRLMKWFKDHAPAPTTTTTTS